MNTPQTVVDWCIQNSPSPFFTGDEISAFFREFTAGFRDTLEYHDASGRRLAVFAILSKLTNQQGYVPVELMGHLAGSDLTVPLSQVAQDIKDHLPSLARGFTIKLQEKFRPVTPCLLQHGYQLLNETYMMVAEPVVRPLQPPKFKVEPVGPSDYRELFTLMQKAFVGDFNIVFPEYESWLRRRTAPGMTSWMIRDRGVMVAFANLVAKSDVLEVRTLGVDPPDQGRGMGAALLNHAMNYALDLGLMRSELSVTTTKRHALKLYESFGFKSQDILMTWGWSRS